MKSLTTKSVSPINISAYQSYVSVLLKEQAVFDKDMKVVLTSSNVKPQGVISCYNYGSKRDKLEVFKRLYCLLSRAQAVLFQASLDVRRMESLTGNMNQQSRAATNDYFHNRLIGRLFKRFID